MVGQKGYIEGRSAITLPLEELQALVEQYAGTGEVHVVKEKIWEEIDLCKTVGYTVSDNDGNVETTWVKIHYSKTGIHAIPLFGGNRK